MPGILYLLAVWNLVSFFLPVSSYVKWASFAYSLMLAGVLSRKRRRIHIAFMLIAVAVDLVLVLTLEFSRGAVARVTTGSLNPFQMAHVLFSSAAAVLYIPNIIFGYFMLSWHRKLGWLVFILRSLGFLFMFSLVT